jgi:hypothetical protein
MLMAIEQGNANATPRAPQARAMAGLGISTIQAGWEDLPGGGSRSLS